MERVQAEAASIKHIDADMGQLEGTSSRPEVAFPCQLIDFQNWTFTDMSEGAQVGIGEVVIKLGFAQFTPSSNHVEAVYRESALEYFDIEQELHEALQGWSPGDDYSVLTRISSTGTNPIKGIRVRTLRYRMEFEDYTTKKPSYKTAKPPLEVESEMETPED